MIKSLEVLYMIVKEAMEIIENTRYYYTPSEEQLFMYTEALEFYMANELDIKKEGIVSLAESWVMYRKKTTLSLHD